MTAPDYTPVAWTNEPVSATKLNTMASNDQWLYENSIKFNFHVYDVQRTSGMKILVGYIYCPNTGGRWSVSNFYFGDFFTPGTSPVVVGGNFTQPPRIDTSVGFKGLDTWLPDHRGVTAWVSHPISVDVPVWVAFAAIGV